MSYKFQPAARLLLQLGDQLIRSDSIAVLELVKNAYDANAKSISVTMSKVENKDTGVITFLDDGDGMNLDRITTVWMQPGTSHKEMERAKKVEKAEADNDDNDGEPKEKLRLPIGGKGIGRFGAHKLGHVIEINTRSEGFKEVRLKIDWRVFETDKSLDQIEIEIDELDIPECFPDGSSGTKIVVRALKVDWTRGDVRKLYRAINSLNSPFNKANSFQALLKLDNQAWLKNLMKFEELSDLALYTAKITLDDNQITNLQYNFTPWETLSKLTSREVTSDNVRMVKKVRNEATKKNEMVDINLGKHKIGQVVINLKIFDRTRKILSLGTSDKAGVEGYLNDNGGMQVFRSGIRVYDYGEPGNDWLNLDLRRVNQPGKIISNNQFLGAVELDLLDSGELIEKTNREGFVESEAFFTLKDAISFAIDTVLTHRNKDKERLQKLYGATSKSQPVVGHISDLKRKISSSVQDPEDRKALLASISGIEKDYKTITDIYSRSASAGLSLGIVIHEISHLIAELSAAVKSKKMDSHVTRLVEVLEKTTSDYAGLLKQSKKSKVSLATTIEQALSNIQFRLKAHEVEIIKGYDIRKVADFKVAHATNLLMSVAINLIDNAIYWQSYAETSKKKIFINIVHEPNGFVSVLIADNGPGFSISPEDATKPFISDKPGGMGLGLHLADEIMSSQRGRMTFPEDGDFDLPSGFQNGAKILLSFKSI